MTTDSAHPHPDARTRIVAVAREMFAESSFAAVSLKEIARVAEVSPALIVKHFHTKENLFAATLDFSESARALFAGPFERLGATAIEETLTAPWAAPYSIVRALTVADGSQASVQAIGERIQSDILRVLTSRIAQEAPHPYPAPRLRAQAAMSLLTGLSMMRRCGDVEFSSFPREQLVAFYATELQSLIDGHPQPR
ncbi:TetR/AcrR family transcriptional regulator [Corynebacterium ciconiae]|uniref:TetR/AcrR family transcriptional regulator n=1 Tax=Corynebacterium ciconiae TaxID=227319 RepID=UPI00037F8FA8|nr:TetR/AcrR family transcriptional regulator [Corynebacterium ciconiae]